MLSELTANYQTFPLKSEFKRHVNILSHCPVDPTHPPGHVDLNFRSNRRGEEKSAPPAITSIPSLAFNPEEAPDSEQLPGECRERGLWSVVGAAIHRGTPSTSKRAPAKLRERWPHPALPPATHPYPAHGSHDLHSAVGPRHIQASDVLRGGSKHSLRRGTPGTLVTGCQQREGHPGKLPILRRRKPRANWGVLFGATSNFIKINETRSHCFLFHPALDQKCGRARHSSRFLNQKDLGGMNVFAFVSISSSVKWDPIFDLIFMIKGEKIWNVLHKWCFAYIKASPPPFKKRNMCFFQLMVLHWVSPRCYRGARRLF